MSDKMRIDELKEVFNKRPFTSTELFEFYLQKEPDLKKTTFRWRIYNLKNEGVIYNLKRGLYTTEGKKELCLL